MSLKRHGGIGGGAPDVKEAKPAARFAPEAQPPGRKKSKR